MQYFPYFDMRVLNMCHTLVVEKPYFVVGREFYIMFLAFVIELATTLSFSKVPTTEKLFNAFSHTLNVEYVTSLLYIQYHYIYCQSCLQV
jgi:hypothetical protein